MRWTKEESSYHARLGPSGPFAAIYDNGGGMGPAKGSGRWALIVNGLWIANLDTLGDAKSRAISEFTAVVNKEES